jgi:Na+/serine symporter
MFVTLYYIDVKQHYATYIVLVVLGGLVIIALAIEPKVLWFKLDRGPWIFKGDKDPWHDFLRRRSKAVASFRKILLHVIRSPLSMTEIGQLSGKINGHFSRSYSPLRY